MRASYYDEQANEVVSELEMRERRSQALKTGKRPLFYRILKDPVPEYNKDTHVLTAGPFVKTGHRVTESWVLRPKTVAELDQAKEALARSVRADRNNRLTACDWTQLPDAVVDQSAWALYRSALRDITKSDTFPENVEWPTAPV